MGLAEQIARVRMQARGAEINARHRRAREKAQRMHSQMGPAAPPDGAHPEFQKTLDGARERARLATERSLSTPKNPEDRIEQLVREGKLPPRANSPGVGYEPTAEEILGEIGAEASPPDGTEELPDAASVLGSDPLSSSAEWGEAPGASVSPGASGAPQGQPGAGTATPALARTAPAVQSKRKRGK